jgi:UrcA family protein
MVEDERQSPADTAMNDSKLTALRVLPLAIAVVAGGGMNPGNTACASDHGGAPTSMKVRLNATDLSARDGVAALYRRIRNAARSVCGYADNHFPEEQAAWNECVDEAIGHAVAQVGNADLTNYYLARAGRGHAIPTTQTSKVADRVR